MIAHNIGYDSTLVDEVLTLLYSAPPVLILGILEALPLFCVGCSEEELTIVVEDFHERLKVLLQQDTSFLLPILGTLFELPLSRNIKREVFRLARDALGIVEEKAENVGQTKQ